MKTLLILIAAVFFTGAPATNASPSSTMPTQYVSQDIAYMQALQQQYVQSQEKHGVIWYWLGSDDQQRESRAKFWRDAYEKNKPLGYTLFAVGAIYLVLLANNVQLKASAQRPIRLFALRDPE